MSPARTLGLQVCLGRLHAKRKDLAISNKLSEQSVCINLRSDSKCKSRVPAWGGAMHAPPFPSTFAWLHPCAPFPDPTAHNLLSFSSRPSSTASG